MDAILLIPIILGWLAGLFINYASDVLPQTRRFSHPACPECQHPFPLRDYLTLRPCRQCGKRRSLRAWLVQILTVGSFVYFWLVPSKALGIPLGMLVLIYFGIITVIDLEHHLILYPTSLVGAVLGLVVGTYIHSRISNSILIGIGKSLLGGAIGFGVLFLLYQLGRLMARRRARKLQAAGQPDDGEDALGDGDVLLAGVLGLMLGSDFIPVGLAWGIIFGGVASILFLIVFLIRHRSLDAALMTFIPYGPFFIFGAALLLFQP